MEILLNRLEKRAAIFTNKECARFERIIIEKRGRAPAPAMMVASIGTAIAQPSNPQSPCSGFLFGVRACIWRT